MQNSEIAKLPMQLLKKTNLFVGPPGVIGVNEQGQSIATHGSPIVIHDVLSLPHATPPANITEDPSCPSCAAMGRQLIDIPYDPSLPYVGHE